jgi:hypothetical protein
VKKFLNHELVVWVVGAEVPLQALHVGLTIAALFPPIPSHKNKKYRSVGLFFFSHFGIQLKKSRDTKRN